MDHQTLRKVESRYFDSVGDIVPSPPETTRSRRLKRLVRITLKDPKDDYTMVQELQSGQGTLVSHKQKSQLLVAVIRESFSPTPLFNLDLIAQIQHQNIAEVLDVYFYDDKLSVVGEYLDLSLLDLGLDRLPAKEWEIATIIAEVIKAMIYLLDTLPTHDLLIDSVRLSVYGDVKLVPDVHYQTPYEEQVVPHRYSSAFLAGILEVLMSHGTSCGRAWSREALEFSSITPSDCLVPFQNHTFLNKAVSPSKLIPRVRMAMQILGCYSRDWPLSSSSADLDFAATAESFNFI